MGCDAEREKKCPHILTLCHSDMFRFSKAHLQGLQLMHFNSKVNKMSYQIYNSTLLTKLNFIFGKSFCWPYIWNVPVVLPEYSTLRVETYRSVNKVVLIINVYSRWFFVWNTKGKYTYFKINVKVSFSKSNSSLKNLTSP